MEKSNPIKPSISLILKRISDYKTLSLFNSIAVIADGEKHFTIKESNITTKQYYSRISGLLSAGLIQRHKGKYSLTSLGKVVYQSQMIIGKTLAYYWKLKAIESIEIGSTSANDTSSLPNEEMTQLINALIDDNHVKNIIMKSFPIPSSDENSSNTNTNTKTFDVVGKHEEQIK